MVAATEALIRTSSNDFEDLDKAWLCCLSVKGRIYKHKPSTQYVVSLGNAKWCAMRFPMQSFSKDGVVYLKASGAAGLPVIPMFNFKHGSDSDWTGVCVEHFCPGLLPADLFAQGLVLAVIKEMDLVPFALLARAPLLRDELIQLCYLQKLKVSKLPGDKFLTMRSYCTFLVGHNLPEETQETKESIVNDICGGAKKTTTESDEHIAQFLDEDNRKYFADNLHGPKQNTLDKSWTLSAESAKGNVTPDALKDFLPPVTGCHLEWQRSQNTFNGYYPSLGKGIQRSSSRRYSGVVATRSMEEALWLVLEFLWSTHTRQGGQPTPLDRGAVEAACVMMVDDAAKESARLSAANQSAAAAAEASGAPASQVASSSASSSGAAVVVVDADGAAAAGDDKGKGGLGPRGGRGRGRGRQPGGGGRRARGRNSGPT